MRRTWFHQCIHQWFSLAMIRRQEVREFLDDYPAQANMRLLEAQTTLPSWAPGQTLDGAFHLPDRRLLFAGDQPFRLEAGSEARDMELAATGTDDHPVRLQPAGQIVRLPVYVRPEPEAEVAVDDEQDWAWNDLEDRLQSDLPTDASGDPEDLANGPDTPPSGASILDTMDLTVDRHAFGRPESDGPDPQGGFVRWLQGLSVPEDTLLPEPDADNGPGKKHGKKKNKAKKQARKLAKASVRKKDMVPTETLARLLEKQGHLKEALDMYERLSLRYPEKKAIFAARIESIKHLRP